MALQYVFRTISLAIAFYLIAAFLDKPGHIHRITGGNELLSAIVQCILWPIYWFFQGLTFAGFWCISRYPPMSYVRSADSRAMFSGHEAGHGSLSSYDWVNHVIGYTLHTVCSSPTVSVLGHNTDITTVPTRSVLRLAPHT